MRRISISNCYIQYKVILQFIQLASPYRMVPLFSKNTDTFKRGLF
jgi:hypothetical protein